MFALAEPIAQLQPTGYVNDFAHVLDPQTKFQIENLCREVDQKAHAHGVNPSIETNYVGTPAVV
jgi:uncharacterized membrane protein YgcG